MGIANSKSKNSITIILNALIFFFTALLLTAIIPIVSALAGSTVFVMDDVKFEGFEGTASGKIVGFDESEATSNVTYLNKGDTAIYKIRFKNQSAIAQTVMSISNDNEDPDLTFSYENVNNREIPAGGYFDFVIKATSNIDQANVLSKISNTKLSVNYLDQTGFVPGVPDTGNFEAPASMESSGAKVSVLLVVLSVSGLIVCVLIKNKKSKILIALVLVMSAFATAFAFPKAANTISVAKNEFLIRNVAIYTDDIAKILNIEVSDKDEWKPEKTVTITSNLSFDGSKYQYQLDGGEWVDYAGPFTINKNNTKIEARVTDRTNGEILAADTTAVKIDPVKPSVNIELDGTYYSGQALDLSTVTSYTAGESGATVRWYIDDLEITNLSDTYLIDRMEEQYEVKVKAVVTSGAGLSDEDYSSTIIIKYARWTGFFIGPLTRNNIGNIKFVSWAEMPENESEWTDISVNQDGAVMEYYVLDSETNLYDVYIASPYGYSRYKDDSMGSDLAMDMSLNIEHITSASAGGANTCQDGHYGMFAYMPKLISIDFSYLDMFNITDMSCMFTNIDFKTTYWDAHSDLTSITWGEKFNTSNVTNMNFAFAGLQNLQSLDLSNFDVSSAERLDGIFARNESLESLSLADWDTSKVRDFRYAFYETPKLKNYDVSKWDTSNAEVMTGMFYAAGVESLDLSGWNVSNVKSFYQLFENAASLKSVDMTGWNTSNVLDMSYMFNRAGVTNLNLSSFDTSNVQRMGDMFSNTPNLTSLDVSNFDTSNVWDMNGMFHTTKMVELNLDNFDTKKVRDFGYFAYNSALETIHFRHLTFSSPNDFYCMFWRATKLKNIYVETIPTIPAGSRTTAMWTNAGTNHFTLKEY